MATEDLLMKLILIIASVIILAFIFSPLFRKINVPNVNSLNTDYCKDKSNKELLHTLQNEHITVPSGNMIVLELLKRLIQKEND